MAADVPKTKDSRFFYFYTAVRDAADDLDYDPERYEDYELLDPDDFL